jgi:hypothetical protein
VGTVSLELNRADAKRSKYTITAFSDDKLYQKKDKSLNEPLHASIPWLQTENERKETPSACCSSQAQNFRSGNYESFRFS